MSWSSNVMRSFHLQRLRHHCHHFRCRLVRYLMISSMAKLTRVAHHLSARAWLWLHAQSPGRPSLSVRQATRRRGQRHTRAHVRLQRRCRLRGHVSVVDGESGNAEHHTPIVCQDSLHSRVDTIYAIGTHCQFRVRFSTLQNTFPRRPHLYIGACPRTCYMYAWGEYYHRHSV